MNDGAADALPDGWAVRRLGQVVEARYGKALPQKARRGGRIAVYGSNGPVGAHNEAITGAPVIIIGRKGSVGAVNYSEAPVWPIDTTYFIDDFTAFEPTFLRDLLSSLELDRMDRSTAIPGLSRGQLYERQIIIPPLAEQRCIAARLDEIEGHRAAVVTSLGAARAKLERFRSAVLTAACSGRLTVDWREAKLGLTDPSLKLDELRAESSRKGRARVPPPDVKSIPDLPDGWAIARIGEIAEVMLGGTPSRKQPAYWHGDVPWVSSGEVANCRITATHERITDDGLANSNAKLYPIETVLIAMIGEGKTRGQSAILDIEASTNQNAAGVLVNRDFLDPEFVWRWAHAQYETTRAVGRGGNQPALNGQKVRELTIPVPALEEQAEIVRRADALLAQADDLLRAVDRIAGALDRGTKAALVKAFRGELLPNTATSTTVSGVAS